MSTGCDMSCTALEDFELHPEMLFYQVSMGTTSTTQYDWLSMTLDVTVTCCIHANFVFTLLFKARNNDVKRGIKVTSQLSITELLPLQFTKRTDI